MRRNFSKVLAAVPVLSAAGALPALADETTATVTSADWASVISAMTGQISVSTLVGAIATAVGAGIGIVFMWWGLRKGIQVLMSAVRKGRMNV